MTKRMITDTAARDAIIAKVAAAKSGSQRGSKFSSDWTRAKYLARGEMIAGLVGGFANSIIFSPKGARSDYHLCDMLFFYDDTGVLTHEEPARVELRAQLGFAA